MGTGHPTSSFGIHQLRRWCVLAFIGAILMLVISINQSRRTTGVYFYNNLDEKPTPRIDLLKGIKSKGGKIPSCSVDPSSNVQSCLQEDVNLPRPSADGRQATAASPNKAMTRELKEENEIRFLQKLRAYEDLLPTLNATNHHHHGSDKIARLAEVLEQYTSAFMTYMVYLDQQKDHVPTKEILKKKIKALQNRIQTLKAIRGTVLTSGLPKAIEALSATYEQYSGGGNSPGQKQSDRVGRALQSIEGIDVEDMKRTLKLYFRARMNHLRAKA